jgi:hypothetical protein
LLRLGRFFLSYEWEISLTAEDSEEDSAEDSADESQEDSSLELEELLGDL